MPDISMCTGETSEGFFCPQRSTCYRHTATHGRWQTYFVNPPMFNKTCEYYMPTESENKTNGKD